MNGNDIYNEIYKDLSDTTNDDANDEVPVELGDFYNLILKLKSLKNAGILTPEIAEEVAWALSKKFKTKYIYL